MFEYIDVTDSSTLEDIAQSSSNLISNSQFTPPRLEATEHSPSNNVLRPLPFPQTYYLHQTTSTTQNLSPAPATPSPTVHLSTYTITSNRTRGLISRKPDVFIHLSPSSSQTAKPTTIATYLLKSYNSSTTITHTKSSKSKG